MNATAKALATLLVAALAVPSSAASIYSGLRIQGPSIVVTAPAPVSGAVLPDAQAEGPLTAAVAPTPAGAASVVAPGAVLPADLAKGPVAPTAASPLAAIAAPAAALPEAASPLQAAAAAVSADGNLGGSSSGDALDELFIGKAKALFHPGLPAGVEPAVAAGLPALPEGVPSDEDARRRMALSPLTNPEREEAVKALFIEAGAKPEEIQTQNAGRNRHNIFVVKKGRTDRVVVVGGHHDKVSEGAGTIDNWTGATMVINLYQAMRDQDTEATFVFIAFSREEEGLVGSRHFVNSLSREQLGKIDAMVNLDTLAVDGTFSWKNNSTRSLLDLFRDTAAAEKLGLDEIVLHGGDSDSSSFRRAGIAAMTLFGASPEVIFDIIHSASDTMAAFSLPHYMNAYKLTLAVIKALGGAKGAPAAA